MVAADFIVTPIVVFSENNAGGIGGALGGLLGGGRGQALGGDRRRPQVQAGRDQHAAGRLALGDPGRGCARQRRVAPTSRSAAALLGGLSAAGGGYSNTNEGKVIVASFLDNWNNIVRNIRNNPSLVQARAGVASQQNAAISVQRECRRGRRRDDARRSPASRCCASRATAAATCRRSAATTRCILAGEEQNGFSKVTTSRGDGWVKSVLLRKP